MVVLFIFIYSNTNYHYIFSYFQDGLKTIEHFRCYIEELVTELTRIRQQQDQEKWQLIELRDALKNSMSLYTQVSNAAFSILVVSVSCICY